MLLGIGNQKRIFSNTIFIHKKLSLKNNDVKFRGFMPSVLYLGFSKGSEPGMPPLSLASLFWA